VKAIVHDRYGPPQVVMRQAEIPDPVAGDGEVLVRVHATSVNPADWHFLRGEPYVMRAQAGLRRPNHKVLGCELAGRVEALGPNVTSFRPGDEVFACTFLGGFGGFAERAAVSVDLLVAKPANLTFEQAAAVPIAALTALQGLRDHAGVEAGQRVLIVGAGGGVGTFAVQIAKHLGAHVTGVCSAGKAELVRSLGADDVVDYTRTDFTRAGDRYDVILQLAGTASPSACRRALTPKGTLVLSSGESEGRVLGPLGRVLKALLLSPVVGQRLVSFTVKPSSRDLQRVKELIEAGQLAPVIDRTYSLSEVPEAIRYLEEGHARGKVAVAVAG
jgi:NADPH:quinone reductase-like Zn-dependent oxidoreductase